MTVKTFLADGDFVSILSQYDLGRYVQSEPVRQGTVQTTFFVTTTRRKVVFRCYENRSRESVLFESDLLSYLEARRFPCPGQIANIHGEFVGTYRGKPYLMFEFVDGQPIEHPSDRHKQQIIRRAAQLQKLTHEFRSEHTPHRWHYDPDLCRALARHRAARMGTEGALMKLAWLVHVLRTLDLPPSLPKGICHCDLHFSNLLFREDELVTVIDFDDANRTFLTFDLVSLIDYWAWPHSADVLDLSTARDIVQDYSQCRPLSSVEQRHLFDVYRLSILFDCVWYFSRGGVADCRERAKIDALTNLGRQAFFNALFRRGGDRTADHRAAQDRRSPRRSRAQRNRQEGEKGKREM